MQFLLLAVDLTGHPIEGAAERAHFVVLRGFVDTRSKLAGANPVRSRDEATDRMGDTVCELEPEPHR